MNAFFSNICNKNIIVFITHVKFYIDKYLIDFFQLALVPGGKDVEITAVTVIMATV